MKVFGYCRVSTTMQERDGYSLGEQKELIQAYCKAMNWNLVKVFTDGGESGAKLERPALKQMISEIRKADRIVVYKLDRLSRSQKDTLYLIEDVFLKNKVDFVSITENFDTSTPFGKAMIGILSVFAQLEREQIKERMMMGRTARAKQGKYVGTTRTPIGYEYVGGKLVVNEFEKIQVQECFRLYIEKQNGAEVARILNAKGYRTRFGEWQDQTVRQAIRNEVYTGKVHLSGEMYEGQHEPIISEELFKEAALIDAERSKHYIRKERISGRANSNLGGLLYCAECGAKLYRKKQSKGMTYYLCHSVMKGENTPCRAFKRYTEEELDEAVFNEIKGLTLDSVTTPKSPDNSRVINAQVEKIDSQIARLVDLYAVADISLDLITDKMDALKVQRELLLAETKKEPIDIKPYLDSFEDIIKYGDLDEIRAVLFALIKRIEVGNHTISIFWNF